MEKWQTVYCPSGSVSWSLMWFTIHGGGVTAHMMLLSRCNSLHFIRCNTCSLDTLSSTISTHSYLLNREDQPQCSFCDCALTVTHILLYCHNYDNVRQRYFSVGTLKELFDTINARYILDFLKDILFGIDLKELGGEGSDVEMFQILPRNWNLKPIITLNWSSVDMNWGGGSTPSPTPPTIPTLGPHPGCSPQPATDNAIGKWHLAKRKYRKITMWHLSARGREQQFTIANLVLTVLPIQAINCHSFNMIVRFRQRHERMKKLKHSLDKTNISTHQWLWVSRFLMAHPYN